MYKIPLFEVAFKETVINRKRCNAIIAWFVFAMTCWMVACSLNLAFEGVLSKATSVLAPVGLLIRLAAALAIMRRG